MGQVNKYWFLFLGGVQASSYGLIRKCKQLLGKPLMEEYDAVDIWNDWLK